MASEARPMFDYATEIDPVMSTFGWKVIGLTYLAVSIPILGAFFPRDAPTNWGSLVVALTGAVAIGGVNLFHFRRMVRSDGFTEPPAIAVLLEVVLGTFLAGLLAYAIGGAAGIYRPIIFVPTLLIATIGNRAMIAITWAAAVLTVTWVAVASGSIDHSTVAFVISYGAVWGFVSVMVHLLSMTSLHSERQTLGIAEAAGIAARANGLTDGLDRMLPVIADWSGARQVAAYRILIKDATGSGERLGTDVGVEAPELLHAWPAEVRTSPPTDHEISSARDARGVRLVSGRAVMVAEGGGDEAVAIVLEGAPNSRFNHLVTRFNLERMVLQVGILVNRSRYIARLEDLGLTDGLTGLPNRRALTARLSEAQQVALRRDDHLALVMLDLDEFKAFNDAYGHLAGDDLLRTFATQLRERLRAVDFVARYGGEEFCVVLPSADPAGAERILDELHQRLREGDAGKVTFSAGIAVWDGQESGEALLGRADRALYAAQDAGRDCTKVDQPTS